VHSVPQGQVDIVPPLLSSYDAAMADLQTLQVSHDPSTGVAVLRFNRPDAGNSLNRAMADELLETTIAWSHDSTVRAIVIAANGKVFMGGGDVAGFHAAGDDASAFIDALTVPFHAAVARLAKANAPVIAAVTGSVGGAGMSLVAACDLVIAGESTKYTMAYTKIGLSPDGTSSFFISRIVGLRRASELVLTNRVLNATEAQEWGLVNRVVPDSEVVTQAMALATQLAGGPTRAFGLAKRLLLDGASSALEVAMERESAAIAEAAGSVDGREGLASFIEKRRPTFDGR
jgi:2-(1,2-epoxy-1,2-dihydrophenyl)acetyl-CoA isomerase